MSQSDVTIIRTAGGNVPTYEWQTEAGEADIKAGEPVKLKSAGSPYAIPCADGDNTIGTDTSLIGIAASDSSHSASEDGTVMVYVPLPGVVYEAKAKTGTNVNTEAKILAMVGDRKVFDLTSGVYTVDDGAADGAANGIVVVGGDPVKETLQFLIRANGTILGDSTIA